MENWYLKYTPEITEDIFNKLVIELNKQFKKFVKHHFECTYNNFKNKEYIRNCLYDTGWCIDNNDQGIKIEKFITDFIKPELDKDALLAEAKLKYPMGTQFKGLSCSTHSSDGRNTWIVNKLKFYEPFSQLNAIANDIGGIIYSGKVWAEIISKPEIKEESKSLVGRYLKILEDNPVGTSYKKGDYIKLLDGTTCTNGYSYSGCIDYWGSSGFELMPENFNPNESKQLTIDDLVEGEIYYHNTTYNFLIKFKKKDNDSIIGDNYISQYDSSNASFNINYRNPNKDTYKIASIEHKKWLSTCIKQNKFIKQEDLHLYDDITFELKTMEKKYYAEVIHCTTQQEWDFVCDKLKSGNYKDNYTKYNYNCMWFNGEGWNTLYFHTQDSKYKIYSFSEWCTKFNHKPDFMEKNKFIVGKWYKDINHDRFLCIKFQKIADNTFLNSSERITPDGHEFKINDSWTIKGSRNWILLTDLLEIQKYLPPNHPDLIVKESNVMTKFTKEQLIQDKYLVYLDNEKEWEEINDFLGFKITSHYCGQHCYSSSDKSYSSSSSKSKKGGYGASYNNKILTINDLSIVKETKSEEWIPKVGDYVVALKTMSNLITENKVYKITEIDGNHFWHLCDNGNSNGYHKSYYRCATLSEIPNNDIPEYVELLEDYWGYLKGDIAKIVEVKSDSYILFVPNRTTTSIYNPNISCGKHKTKSSTKTAYDSQFIKKESDDKWCVGGWVKCLESGKYNNEFYTKGKYYQITKPGTIIYILGDSGHNTALIPNTECEWIGMNKPELVNAKVNPESSISIGRNAIPPSLPDKWCIKVSPSVKDYISKNITYTETTALDSYFHFPKVFNYHFFHTCKSTEITQEQFDYWVLDNRSLITGTKGDWLEQQEESLEQLFKYPLIEKEVFKNKPIVTDNMVNILVKQSESVTLKRAEDEIKINVKNSKTIKI